MALTPRAGAGDTRDDGRATAARPPGHAHAHIHPDLLAAVIAVGAALRDLARQRLEAGAPPPDPLRGLHLEPIDLERLLAQPPLAAAEGLPEAEREPFRVPLQDDDSPLGIAVRQLALDPFEAAVIVLCLLPEIDGRYGSVISFLHDDMTRKTASVELALALCAPSGPAGLEYLHVFTPRSALRRWELVHLAGEDTLIRQQLALDRSFLWFLLGERRPDAELGAIARALTTDRPSGTRLPPPLAALLAYEDAAPAPPVLLHGADEQSCMEVASAAARAMGRPLLVVDGERLAATEAGPALLRRCLREAVLKGLLPCLTHAATLLQPLTRGAQEYKECVLTCPSSVLLVGDAAEGETAYAGPGIVPLTVPMLPVAERIALWSAAAEEHGVEVDEATLLALAETATGFSEETVAEVAAVARATAAAAAERPSARHLQRALRGALRQRVTTLALIAPRYGWADIVLPPDRLQLLRHLSGRVRYRSRVRDEWGVGGATLPGVTALFAGQPGTGKSMAAEIVARDLGLDLYKIDLAQVVSKYIGETEKNLARVFDEADAGGVVLVFDEADALFGKRSDVKDSHDRYANIEISYLLQRMERYRGLVILTTNLRANLDDAFTRRIGVSVDFPLPTPADRLRIWQRSLAEAPRDAALDFGELAERLELAGGAIVNVAVAAAHLAAEEHGVINRERLLRAVRWELQKMGRLMAGDALEALMPAVAGPGGNGRYP